MNTKNIDNIDLLLKKAIEYEKDEKLFKRVRN